MDHQTDPDGDHRIDQADALARRAAAYSDSAPVEIERTDTVSTCPDMPSSGPVDTPGTSPLDTIPNESWLSDIDSDFVAAETAIRGYWHWLS